MKVFFLISFFSGGLDSVFLSFIFSVSILSVVGLFLTFSSLSSSDDSLQPQCCFSSWAEGSAVAAL